METEVRIFGFGGERSEKEEESQEQGREPT